MWLAHVLYNDFRHFFRMCGARLRFASAYQNGESQSRCQQPALRRREARWHTSSIASINGCASFSPRHLTISDAFLVKNTALMRDANSSLGPARLIKRCKARLSESGTRDGPGVSEGGPVSSERLRSSSRNKFGIGESDPLNCLSYPHHVSILSQVHRQKTLT